MSRIRGRTVAPLVVLSCFAALSWLGGAAPARCQEPGPAARPGFEERIDIRLTTVDVVALDKGGDVVRDLEAQDFRLTIDGKPGEVTHFFRGEDPLGVRAERLSIVVYFDELHLLGYDRVAIAGAIQSFLQRQVDSGAWGMVVRFDGDLELKQPLTRNTTALSLALSSVARGESVIAPSTRQLRSTIEQVREGLRLVSGRGSEIRMGTAAIKSSFNQLLGLGSLIQHEGLSSASSMLSILDAMALLPGRKVLIWVSSGLPLQPLDRVADLYRSQLYGSRTFDGNDLMEGSAEGWSVNSRQDRSSGGRLEEKTGTPDPRTIADDGGANDFQRSITGLSLQPALQRVAAAANSNRVAIFPLKPLTSLAGDTGLGDRAADGDSRRSLSDLASGLDYLATETGGSSLLAGVEVDAFPDRTTASLGHYYSLGFSAAESSQGAVGNTLLGWAGRPTSGVVRGIRVKAKRRGVRVMHRRSYLPRSLDRQLADRAAGVLLLGWKQNPHEVRIEAGSSRSRGEDYEAEVVLSVPVERLELQESAGILEGELRVVAQIQLESGGWLPSQYWTFPVAVAAGDWDQARDQLLGFRLPLLLPEGEHRLALGIWEPRASVGSFLPHRLRVGESGTSLADGSNRVTGRPPLDSVQPIGPEVRRSRR